jgi:hypothetical protein
MIKPENDNKDLESVKKFLSGAGISPDNAIAYSGPVSEIEILKESIRKETKGHCYFFSKKENNITHLIALVKIQNIGQVFEKTIEKIKFNHINTSVSHQSDFNPQGISFGKFKK